MTTNPLPLTVSIDRNATSHFHRRGCTAARRNAVDVIDVELAENALAALKAEAADLNSDTRFHDCMKGA